MKELFKQIEFLDLKLLPVFGIKSIIDYSTYTYINNIKRNTDFLDNINKLVTELKEKFPARELNLHKTDNKVKTHLQAFGILKKCLTIANVLFELKNKKNTVYLRLIQKNHILDEYIKTKEMSDIPNSFIFNDSSESVNFSKKIGYEEMVTNIKKYEEKAVYYPLFMLTNNDGVVKIPDIKFLRMDLSGVKIDFVSKQIDGVDLYNEELIDKLFYNQSYSIKFNDKEYYSKILEKDQNILPDVILPTRMCNYVSISIEFSCSQYEEFKDTVVVKLTVERPIFKKAMDKTLSLTTAEIDIPSKNESVGIKFKSGLVGFDKKENPVNHTSYFSSGEFEFNGYKSVKIDKDILHNANLNESNDDSFTQCAFMGLCVGYDCATFTNCPRIIKPIFWHIDNGRIVLEISLVLSCDKISDIKFDLGADNNVEPCDIEIFGVPVEFYIFGKTVGITDHDINNQILRNPRGHNQIKLWLPMSCDILKIVKNIKVQLTQYFYSQEIRREIYK